MRRAAPKTRTTAPPIRHDGVVVAIAPARTLARTRQEVVALHPHCPKCGSSFVEREPAFLHCRYCGHLARIPNGSLMAQELFELRSGFRLAS